MILTLGLILGYPLGLCLVGWLLIMAAMSDGPGAYMFMKTIFPAGLIIYTVAFIFFAEWVSP